MEEILDVMDLYDKEMSLSEIVGISHEIIC